MIQTEAFWGPGSSRQFLQNESDVISLIIHERGGHGEDYKLGMEYNIADFWAWERRAVDAQINHESWETTSVGFKAYMYEVYGKDLYTPEEQQEYFGKYGVELDED